MVPDTWQWLSSWQWWWRWWWWCWKLWWRWWQPTLNGSWYLAVSILSSSSKISLLNTCPSHFFTILLFKTPLNPDLSLKNLSFTEFLFLPTFTFPHNSGTQRHLSSFRGLQSDSVTEQSPSSPHHLASHIPTDTSHTLKQRTMWCQLEMMLLPLFVFLEDLN